MRWHLRCSNSKCQARGVSRAHPDTWEKERKCWSCGGTRFRVDKWMQNRDTRREGCTCSGYKWPGAMTGALHRKGSKACWYRKDGTQRMPGDPDFYDPEYEEYYGEHADIST